MTLPFSSTDNQDVSDLREASALVASGMSPTEAAELVGVTIPKEGLPRYTGFMPTPEMIVAGCEEIRRGWSPAETEKRNAPLAVPLSRGRGLV